MSFQTEAVHQTGESLSAVKLLLLDGRMMMPLLEDFHIMLEEFLSGMGGLGEVLGWVRYPSATNLSLPSQTGRGITKKKNQNYGFRTTYLYLVF